MKQFFVRKSVMIYLSLFFFSISAFAQLSASVNSEKIMVALTEKVYNNPIIPDLGVCDPHIHIFNNRAYLFASHDEGPGNTFYNMNDWWIWSSSDLVHWQLDFTLYPKDMWVGATKNSWAVDGAERNGKHYFYVSGNWNTGVAVSNNGPAGPYNDALGKALCKRYDPTVFIDDDENKTPYLVISGFPYKIAKLNDDMISLADEPVDLIHTTQAWKGDGGFLHKRNGIYYLNGHGCNYSTATNVYGPYTYRGKFHQKWIDHPTIFNWNNQTFCTFGESDKDRFHRKTCMTYIYYKDNGDIVADEEVAKSFIGVGQYDCSKKIQAEWYFAASEGTNKKEIKTGFAVGDLTNKSYLYYPRVLNVAGNATFTVNIASAHRNATIEIRQNKPNGALLGKIEIPNTGSLSTYQTVNTQLKCKSGLTNIYLVYRGKQTANIDWFSLSSTGVISAPPKSVPEILPCEPSESAQPVLAYQQIESEEFACSSGIQVTNCKDGDNAKAIAYVKDKSNCAYKIDFGTTTKDSLLFQVRVSTESAIGGTIELRLNGIDGPLLGTCKVIDTGGWESWRTVESMIKASKGIQTLFLVFRGENEYLLNLNWMRFLQ